MKNTLTAVLLLSYSCVWGIENSHIYEIVEKSAIEIRLTKGDASGSPFEISILPQGETSRLELNRNALYNFTSSFSFEVGDKYKCVIISNNALPDKMHKKEYGKTPKSFAEEMKYITHCIFNYIEYRLSKGDIDISAIKSVSIDLKFSGILPDAEDIDFHTNEIKLEPNEFFEKFEKFKGIKALEFLPDDI